MLHPLSMLHPPYLGQARAKAELREEVTRLEARVAEEMYKTLAAALSEAGGSTDPLGLFETDEACSDKTAPDGEAGGLSQG